MTAIRSNRSTILISIVVTVLYGYGVFFLFEGDNSLTTLSWSFIMLLPYAIGALGVFVQMRRGHDMSLIGAVLYPWLYLIGLCVVLVIFSAGILFCFVIGVPILFPAASLGGFTMWTVKKNPKLTYVIIMLTLLSPIGAGTVEAQVELPFSTTVTVTTIDIDATVAEVWDEIKSVSPITESEHSANWLHGLGFPRPVAATLSYEGVGGVRDATFEQGLRFDETITEWEHHKRISFSIVETSEDLLPPPLNLIDGEHFDVLAGTYEIETLDDGTVRLHLTSEHTLGTRFNDYGAWWTDQVMRNLQNYILDIVKTRVESAG